MFKSYRNVTQDKETYFIGCTLLSYGLKVFVIRKYKKNETFSKRHLIGLFIEFSIVVPADGIRILNPQNILRDNRKVLAVHRIRPLLNSEFCIFHTSRKCPFVNEYRAKLYYDVSCRGSEKGIWLERLPMLFHFIEICLRDKT